MIDKKLEDNIDLINFRVYFNSIEKKIIDFASSFQKLLDSKRSQVKSSFSLTLQLKEISKMS